MTGPWTLAEAAVIVGKPLDAVQRTVERVPLKPTTATRKGGRKVVVLHMHDLVYLRAFDELKETLKPTKQVELYHLLMKHSKDWSDALVAVGHLRYDFGEAYSTVKERIAESEQLLELIDRTGDEPLIKGTHVSAYRLAALTKGMTFEEIARDYPGLDERQVKAAVTFAESHPKKGRPYPQVSAKKAMRDAGVKDADRFLPARG
mgnify:CR=1 FL=1